MTVDRNQQIEHTRLMEKVVLQVWSISVVPEEVVFVATDWPASPGCLSDAYSMTPKDGRYSVVPSIAACSAMEADYCCYYDNIAHKLVIYLKCIKL